MYDCVHQQKVIFRLRPFLILREYLTPRLRCFVSNCKNIKSWPSRFCHSCMIKQPSGKWICDGWIVSKRGQYNKYDPLSFWMASLLNSYCFDGRAPHLLVLECLVSVDGTLGQHRHPVHVGRLTLKNPVPVNRSSLPSLQLVFDIYNDCIAFTHLSSKQMIISWLPQINNK